MAGFSDYLPTFLKQATGLGTKQTDHITFIEICSAAVAGMWKQLLLLGYERGFQVWDLADVNRPVLWVSKRTVAIAIMKALPTDDLSLLLLTHLYDSTDFPTTLIRTYSLTTHSYQAPIHCLGEVLSLHTSSKAICILTVPGTLEVLTAKTRERLYVVQLCRSDPPGTVLQFAMSNLYFAYSMKKPVQPDEPRPDEGITGLVTRSLYSLADQSFATVKSYIETGTATTFPAAEGKVVVRHVLTKAGICDIQAFPCAVAQIQFAESGHLLMVAAESGQYLHVYRMNPPLSQQKNGALVRYALLYKLYRGFTQATITDISLSQNEQWVVVTSSRGTAHVYKIDPGTTSLHYDHQVYTRIKRGWFSGESSPSPKCHISTSQRQLSRERLRFEEPLLVSEAPVMVSVTMAGRFSTYEVGEESVEVAAVDLAREIGFVEVEGELRRDDREEKRRNRALPVFCPDPGWLPLALSPQIHSFTTTTSVESLVLSTLDLRPSPTPSFQASHIVHYSSPTSCHTQLLATLQSSIADTQTVPTHVNKEFIVEGEDLFGETMARLD